MMGCKDFFVSALLFLYRNGLMAPKKSIFALLFRLSSIGPGGGDAHEDHVIK
jgi:hypothetical protein